MTGRESDEELIAVESECLRRFRKQAALIKEQNPLMADKICFCRAVEALKETSNRYAFARSCLQARGIPALPLR
jgi:hypothetical protein